MKAVVLREHGEDGLHYETGFRDPTPGAGDVVVRVRAASLNYHDIFTRRGIPGIKTPMPAIMGLDVAGEIVALGRAFRAGRSATVCSAIRSTGSRAGSLARPCMAGSPNIAGCVHISSSSFLMASVLTKRRHSPVPMARHGE